MEHVNTPIQFFSHTTLWSNRVNYDIFGIYALVWPDQKAIYIGQSKYVADRLIGHINKLKDGYHDNYKILSFYNLTGIYPKVAIIEETWKLDSREMYWIKKYQFDGWNMLNRKLDWNNKGILIPDIIEDDVRATIPSNLIKVKGWKENEEITIIPTEKGFELVKTSDLK